MYGREGKSLSHLSYDYITLTVGLSQASKLSVSAPLTISTYSMYVMRLNHQQEFIHKPHSDNVRQYWSSYHLYHPYHPYHLYHSYHSYHLYHPYHPYHPINSYIAEIRLISYVSSTNSNRRTNRGRHPVDALWISRGCNSLHDLRVRELRNLVNTSSHTLSPVSYFMMQGL